MLYFSARIFWALQRFAEDRAAAEELHAVLAPSTSTVETLVHAADDAFFAAGRHLGHCRSFRFRSVM